MSLQLLTPPAAEPVSLAEAKAHLKIDTADEDALIASLVTAARARAEWHTGRAFVTQSWCLWLDAWPRDGIAALPLPPVQAVSEAAFTAIDGIRSVIAPAAYRLDVASNSLVLSDPHPPARLRSVSAVEIRFTAGYGDAQAVPAPVKQAILQIVASLYIHRGDDAVVPTDAAALLAPYRVFKL